MGGYKNHILGAMSLDDRILIEPHLEEVALPVGKVIVEYQTPITHVYFLESGLASSVVASPDGHVVETLVVGVEGYVGMPIVLASDRTPAKVFMQIGGRAWRIEADGMRQTMDLSSTFRAALLRYIHAALTQTSYTALSNSAHRVEQRLARWLLMAHDRIEGDTVALTHHSLAFMLDVRRSSVTDALHIVEGMGLIRSLRGRIVIRDRDGLEALARPAYGVSEAGTPRPVAPPVNAFSPLRSQASR